MAARSPAKSAAAGRTRTRSGKRSGRRRGKARRSLWGLGVAVALCAIAFGVLILLLLLPPTDRQRPLAVIDLDRRTARWQGPEVADADATPPALVRQLVAPKSTPDPLRPFLSAAPSAVPSQRPDGATDQPQPVQVAAHRPPPVVVGLPTWRRNAVPASVPAGRGMIAIVIDDLGLNLAATEAAIALPPPITLSFLTYGEALPDQTAAARAAGHELLVHVPMQPVDPMHDPGPHALMVELEDAEILRRLRWGLERFEGYVGINNHMGSRFTADPRAMDIVLSELRSRGLLMLDSVTSAQTVAFARARDQQVPAATRQVFLDHDRTAESVADALREVERLARSTGQAIAIGHPHPATLSAIRDWLPTLDDSGLVLVPLSAIVVRGWSSGFGDRT